MLLFIHVWQFNWHPLQGRDSIRLWLISKNACWQQRNGIHWFSVTHKGGEINGLIWIDKSVELIDRYSFLNVRKTWKQWSKRSWKVEKHTDCQAIYHIIIIIIKIRVGEIHQKAIIPLNLPWKNKDSLK